MYSNSFSRIKLLFLIEWKKRAKVILGFTIFSMLLMFATILLEAQRFRLAPSFFSIHFYLSLFILVGIQIATLFPEWQNRFQSCQYLQTPATVLEKYISRLAFPFIIAPGIYIVAFLLCRPLCLQFSLTMKGFMPYPMYWPEIKGMIILSYFLSFYFFALFIPGAIWLNRNHLIKSALLGMALFFSIALISAMFGLPLYETTSGERSDRMFAAEFQGIALFFATKYSLIWPFIIMPILFLSGYYLLKHREA